MSNKHKIAMVNTFDVTGGAAKACYRVFDELRSDAELDLNFFCQQKKSNDPAVKLVHQSWQKYQDKIPLALGGKRPHKPWSASLIASGISKKINDFKPDLVHLNWINRGFFGIPDLVKIKAPLIWTFHDSWPFTGGCHVPGVCLSYQAQCGVCPQLSWSFEQDLSRQVWQHKAKHWSELKMTIVTPSRWLAEKVSHSSLFKHQKIVVIPNGLNTEVFKPYDKKLARQTLGLPLDKKIILFGAMNANQDLNKGHDLLLQSFSYLKNHEALMLVCFGHNTGDGEKLSLATHNMGEITDEHKLAQLYSASDVMCVPSRYESFCQTASEAQACGTPVVAFNASGVVEVVEHKITGYLAKSFSAEDFANGIKFCLGVSASENFVALARSRTQSHFDIKVVAKHYRDLYFEQLNNLGN